MKHFNLVTKRPALPQKADDDWTFILLEAGNVVAIVTMVLSFLRLVVKGPEASQI